MNKKYFEDLVMKLRGDFYDRFTVIVKEVQERLNNFCSKYDLKYDSFYRNFLIQDESVDIFTSNELIEMHGKDFLKELLEFQNIIRLDPLMSYQSDFEVCKHLHDYPVVG